MNRKVIKIDENKCVGCGLCAKACQQSAIEMVNGKAKVVRDDYCDGIGNCLPVCPVNAISFSDKDVVNIKSHEVNEEQDIPMKTDQPTPVQGGCPGSRGMELKRESKMRTDHESKVVAERIVESAVSQSELRQWPVQIKLVPVQAAYFEDAHLLIAADCTAFSYSNFHKDFMKNKVTLIGCPKLDAGDYTEKLTEIIKNNNIKSVTIVRMEVPCCRGIYNAAVEAMKRSGKFLPWQDVVISLDGKILDN